MTSSADHRRGVALVLAMLVVALASALAVSMGNDYLVRLRRFDNQLSAEQAHYYLLSAEQMATHVLLENSLLYGESAVDHLGEAWNHRHSISIDGGELRFRFESIGAQMPINEITNGSNLAGRNAVPYNIYQRRFIRLLRSFNELPLSEQEALEITQAIFDWIDSNTQPEGLGGMEDGSYQNLGLDYRPRNNFMTSLSELQLIPRISPRLYRLLAPHVSISIPSASIGINVNTASRNVLRSLPNTYGLSPISDEELDNILSTHGRQFSSVSSFQNLSGWSGAIEAPGLNVRNREFLMRAEVLFNDHSFRLISLMSMPFNKEKEHSRILIAYRSYSWL